MVISLEKDMMVSVDLQKKRPKKRLKMKLKK
jgi:hypothetical protein